MDYWIVYIVVTGSVLWAVFGWLVPRLRDAAWERRCASRPLEPFEREALLGWVNHDFKYVDRPEPRQDDDAAWLAWHNERVFENVEYWKAYNRLSEEDQYRLDLFAPYSPPVQSPACYDLAWAKSLYPGSYAWQLEWLRQKAHEDTLEAAAWQTAHNAAQAAAAARRAAGQAVYANRHHHSRHH